MDWTNNYGVRPLLPWSGQWFYGDLVYIVDPWLWLALGGASFLLTARDRWRTVFWALLALLASLAFILLPVRAGLDYPFASRALWFVGLIGLIVAHRMNFAIRWGSSIALASLAFVVVYWGALGFLHARAVAQAHATADSLARRTGESVLRVAAMPSLADPMRWRVLAETNRATYRFDTSLSVSGQVNAEILAGLARYEKPQGEALAQVERAAQDERAAIFLDFARFSAVRVEPQSCAAEFLVRFADLRFTEPGNTRRGGNFALDVPVSGLP
jgi:inner membrane protein